MASPALEAVPSLVVARPVVASPILMRRTTDKSPVVYAIPVSLANNPAMQAAKFMGADSSSRMPSMQSDCGASILCSSGFASSVLSAQPQTSRSGRAPAGCIVAVSGCSNAQHRDLSPRSQRKESLGLLEIRKRRRVADRLERLKRILNCPRADKATLLSEASTRLQQLHLRCHALENELAFMQGDHLARNGQDMTCTHRVPCEKIPHQYSQPRVDAHVR